MRVLITGLALGCSLLGGCGGGSGTGGTAAGASTASPSPLPDASLLVQPAVVARGGSALLSWSSTNAASCVASDGWSGAVAASGTRAVGPISATTSYSLVCSGAGGSSKAALATVSVSAPPSPSAALAVTPSAIANGASTTLSWSSVDAAACTASGGWTGALAPAGTRLIGPLNRTTSFSLVCSGAGGDSSAAEAIVSVAPVPPPTVSLAADPTLVAAGGSAVLTWTSTGATACAASNGWSGTLPASGSRSVGPVNATTLYTLICTGAGGASSAESATVSVSTGSITVTPHVAAVSRSQSAQFTATLTGGGTARWTVDGVAGGNASVGTITIGGLYRPGGAVGPHLIEVSSSLDSSRADRATVAVTDLAGVYRYHNDNAQDGLNDQEYALTHENVNTATFGKLFSCGVDGAVYAQPLWVANVLIGGARHNVVFVATQHDSLYAFDADANPCVPLWTVSLIDADHGGSGDETPVPSGPADWLVGNGNGDITPEVGITGTPVIDPVGGTLYVVAKSVAADRSTFSQRLHAIDLATGAEKGGSPINIEATYPGSGDGGTDVGFDPRQENQRAALALVGGVVYIAWCAHEDARPYYGWIMGYRNDGASFTQVSTLNVAPNGRDGAVWMGGAGPAADASNQLYVITGNGTFDMDGAAPADDYGDSVLRLDTDLSVRQYFTPSDQAADDVDDKDFGSGGPTLLPELPAGSPVRHLFVGGGKDGALYLLDRDTLGGFGDGAAIQKVELGHGIFATGAYWNGFYYLAASRGALTAYRLDPSAPSLAVASATSDVFRFPGSTPSVSAAGATNGIVWALDNSQYCTSEARGCGPAVLHAYDAADVSHELWNSGMLSADAAGNPVKFTVPTIANGKVYVGTRGDNDGGAGGSTSVSGQIDVYGLISNP